MSDLQPIGTSEPARAWKMFWQRVASHMFGVAKEHIIDDTFEPDEHQLALAESIIERLCRDIGLEQRWLAWVTEVNGALPDPDAAMPSPKLPHQLPLPPDEPAGATVKLLSKAGHDQLEGWAASWVLYHLALARAVREVRGRNPLGRAA
jgi:hypothetical protein